MRELIDCHIHTDACGHASGTAAQMIGAAVFAGLSGVVLTEHLPLPQELNSGGGLAPDPAGFARYAEDVRATATRVKGLEVVLGAEADWLPERPEAMAAQRATAEAADVQVLLGSVHFLGDWPFDSPDHLEGWDSRGVDAVWEQYFAVWCDAARSGQFDVMAHPDLAKKFGHRPSYDAGALYAEAADAAKDGGVLVEVSTGGLRKPVGELYPAHELLAAFHARGVQATVGSDAHSPSEVGYEIAAAYEALRAAGYSRVAMPVGRGEVRWIQL